MPFTLLSAGDRPHCPLCGREALQQQLPCLLVSPLSHLSLPFLLLLFHAYSLNPAVCPPRVCSVTCPIALTFQRLLSPSALVTSCNLQTSTDLPEIFKSLLEAVAPYPFSLSASFLLKRIFFTDLLMSLFTLYSFS